MNKDFSNHKYIKKSSMKGSPTNSKQGTIKKKVTFIDEVINEAKEQGAYFTIEFFYYIFDKFFSVDRNFVCVETNNEYTHFLEEEKKENDEFDKANHELDDFFLGGSSNGNDLLNSKKDNNISKMEYASQNNDSALMNKSIVNEEDVQFQQHLEKTIAKYEEMIKKNQFKTEKDKQETLKLIALLKQQLKQFLKNEKDNLMEIQENNSGDKKNELDELRMKGLKEIFHFYSR